MRPHSTIETPQLSYIFNPKIRNGKLKTPQLSYILAIKKAEIFISTNNKAI